MHRRRPHFIWTPTQAIDPQGPAAAFLGRTRANEKNRWFLFRKTVKLNASSASALLSITCDGRYILYVNRMQIGRGPARSSPLFQRYDDYDITNSLEPGQNVIGVLVHTYGIDTSFYETTKGMWQPTFGDGGLWCSGTIDGTAFATDESWRCVEASAWNREHSEEDIEAHAHGFIEDFDARRFPHDWLDADFDDGTWDQAALMFAGGGGPEARSGGMEVVPFPILVPRGIPLLAERLARPRGLVRTFGLRPNSGLSGRQRAFDEACVELPAVQVVDARDLLGPAPANTKVRTGHDCDVALLFDFGRIVTGRPRIELQANGGETIEILCAEQLPGEWQDVVSPASQRISPVPGIGNFISYGRYTARAGDQHFEQFEWYAARWLQLIIRNAPNGLRLRLVGLNLCNYPVERPGTFVCSDPLLNQLWETGVHTLQQCMHDAWEDCPGREQRQWLGDVAVENLVGWAAFGPCVAPLTAKFLEDAAESQRPDGLTQMFAPGDHKTNGNLMPDWTLHWILIAEDYYRYSADQETIRRIFPSILKALAWFEQLIGPSGLVADMPYWRFVDWAGVGRDGESAVLNAQLAGAFRAASCLAHLFGWGQEGLRLSARAKAIDAALEHRHWDERRGVYVDMVDPVTGAQDPRVSQHSNAAIALWCEVAPSRVERALQWVSEGDRLTMTAAPAIVPSGMTLDLENGVVMANTFFSHFVYEALAKWGRFGDALNLIRRNYGPMLQRGATTLWESFQPTGSLCHGFSTSPVFHLSRRVLGVQPLVPGFSRIEIAPDLGDLQSASGDWPTPFGDVRVSLLRDSSGFSAEVQVPDDVEAVVSAPQGLVLESCSPWDRGRCFARFRRASEVT